jgi:prepilin-type N-terminal cleavage/methylation domain-containing protein
LLPDLNLKKFPASKITPTAAVIFTPSNSTLSLSSMNNPKNNSLRNSTLRAVVMSPITRGFTLIELLVVIAIIAMPLRVAQAQPGSVDLTFDAGELTGDPPQAFSFTVIEDMALLADGRISPNEQAKA